MAYDRLVFVNGRWVWCPKPWPLAEGSCRSGAREERAPAGFASRGWREKGRVFSGSQPPEPPLAATSRAAASVRSAVIRRANAAGSSTGDPSASSAWS